MPTCTVDTLVNVASKWRSGGQGPLDPKQRKAIAAYLHILELAALGGTDYRSNYRQLISDAQSLEKGQTQDGIAAAEVAILASNATSAGASVPSTLNGLMAAVATDGNGQSLLNLDDFMLQKIDLLLSCKLGPHASAA